MRLHFFALLILAFDHVSRLSHESLAADAVTKPNIVYILCDDLGYGDVHVLNPERGKIATPNIDRLASEAITFTDAHSGSSVCTPTRYGILTGRYAWRTHLQSGVLGGFSEPLIAKDRLTVGQLLKQQGYTTGCIGKWHLGMEFTQSNGAAKNKTAKNNDPAKVDYAAPLKDGPLQHGFDYYYGITASLDMPPFVFIENDRFTQLPTVEKQWIRKGPAAQDFEAIDVLPTLTKKAVEFITKHANGTKLDGSKSEGIKSGQPFFLYIPLNSPHTPIVPTKEWQGKSGLGDYADFVMETDWAIGQILAAIKTAGIENNTLVIFTSDNGCSPAAKPTELEAKGHFPSAQFRGYKADIWEGGHHIPFLAKWPGKVQPGSRCETTICLTDLLATCADVLGQKLPDNAAEDSVSLLPLLRGEKNAKGHEAVVHHSIQGMFAIRQANWKLELCAGSGGWGSPKDPQAIKEGLPEIQLYDMSKDIGERTNEGASHPEVVDKLTKLLQTYVTSGRSTPGAKQTNDAKIDVYKKVNGTKVPTE